jgi:hypothetical protein
VKPRFDRRWSAGSLLPKRGDYRNPLRWSHEDDWWWGPFTYSWTKYRPLSIMLNSWGGGEDDDRPCNLHLSWFWGVLIIRLPNWLLQPHIEKVYPDDPAWKAPDGEVYKRLGRDYYDSVDVRSYGFSLSNTGMIGSRCDFLQVSYGRAGGSMMDSSLLRRAG